VEEKPGASRTIRQSAIPEQATDAEQEQKHDAWRNQLWEAAARDRCYALPEVS